MNPAPPVTSIFIWFLLLFALSWAVRRLSHSATGSCASSRHSILRLRRAPSSRGYSRRTGLGCQSIMASCSAEKAGDFADKGIGFPAVGSFTLFMVFLVVFIVIVIVVIPVSIAFLFGGDAVQDNA